MQEVMCVNGKGAVRPKAMQRLAQAADEEWDTCREERAL